jgi:hypothetical protein
VSQYKWIAAALLATSACFGSPEYENEYTEQAPRTDQLTGTSPVVQFAPAAPAAYDCGDAGDDASCQTPESTKPGDVPSLGNPPPVPWSQIAPPPPVADESRHFK